MNSQSFFLASHLRSYPSFEDILVLARRQVREIHLKMPTCMHIAYHNEAKRKQRIIERKQAALQRILDQQVTEKSMSSETLDVLVFW